MSETICFTLPEWVREQERRYSPLLDIRQRMNWVLDAAWKNVEQRTGGPFAAAIFERASGKLVALGVNRVVPQGLSILHAEMTAFSLAQQRLGHYDLGHPNLPEHELVTSTEPCAMCLGAVCWSGVRRVISAASGNDAQAVGFDEGPKPQNWIAELRARNIDVVAGIERQRAAQILLTYHAADGPIYNGRRER